MPGRKRMSILQQLKFALKKRFPLFSAAVFLDKLSKSNFSCTVSDFLEENVLNTESNTRTLGAGP